MDLVRLVRIILGIPYLIIGAMCIAVVVYLIGYGIYPQELTVIYFQMACMAAGFMGILLGLESIVFPSRNKRGDRNSIIYDILISVSFGIVLISTGTQFSNVYLGETIVGSPTDMWDETTLTFYALCYTLSNISAIIFFSTLILLAFLLYKNIKQGAEAAPTEAEAAPADTQPSTQPKNSTPTDQGKNI